MPQKFLITSNGHAIMSGNNLVGILSEPPSTRTCTFDFDDVVEAGVTISPLSATIDSSSNSCRFHILGPWDSEYYTLYMYSDASEDISWEYDWDESGEEDYVVVLTGFNSDTTRTVYIETRRVLQRYWLQIYSNSTYESDTYYISSPYEFNVNTKCTNSNKLPSYFCDPDYGGLPTGLTFNWNSSTNSWWMSGTLVDSGTSMYLTDGYIVLNPNAGRYSDYDMQLTDLSGNFDMLFVSWSSSPIPTYTSTSPITNPVIYWYVDGEDDRLVMKGTVSANATITFTFKELLATPTNISISNDVVSFNAVTNANRYDIYWNDNKLGETTSTSYNLAQFYYDTLNGTVKIQAVDTTGTYENSDFGICGTTYPTQQVPTPASGSTSGNTATFDNSIDADKWSITATSATTNVTVTAEINKVASVDLTTISAFQALADGNYTMTYFGKKLGKANSSSASLGTWAKGAPVGETITYHTKSVTVTGPSTRTKSGGSYTDLNMTMSNNTWDTLIVYAGDTRLGNYDMWNYGYVEIDSSKLSATIHALSYEEQVAIPEGNMDVYCNWDCLHILEKGNYDDPSIHLAKTGGALTHVQLNFEGQEESWVPGFNWTSGTATVSNITKEYEEESGWFFYADFSDISGSVYVSVADAEKVTINATNCTVSGPTTRTKTDSQYDDLNYTVIPTIEDYQVGDVSAFIGTYDITDCTSFESYEVHVSSYSGMPAGNMVLNITCLPGYYTATITSPSSLSPQTVNAYMEYNYYLNEDIIFSGSATDSISYTCSPNGSVSDFKSSYNEDEGQWECNMQLHADCTVTITSTPAAQETVTVINNTGNITLTNVPSIRPKDEFGFDYEDIVIDYSVSVDNRLPAITVTCGGTELGNDFISYGYSGETTGEFTILAENSYGETIDSGNMVITVQSLLRRQVNVSGSLPEEGEIEPSTKYMTHANSLYIFLCDDEDHYYSTDKWKCSISENYCTVSFYYHDDRMAWYAVVTWTATGEDYTQDSIEISYGNNETITLINNASDKFTFTNVPTRRSYDEEEGEYNTVTLNYTIASGYESYRPNVAVKCDDITQSPNFIYVSLNGNTGRIYISGHYEDEEIDSGDMEITVTAYQSYAVTYTDVDGNECSTQTDINNKIDIDTYAWELKPRYTVSPTGAATDIDWHFNYDSDSWFFKATISLNCNIIFTNRDGYTLTVTDVNGNVSTVDTDVDGEVYDVPTGATDSSITPLISSKSDCVRVTWTGYSSGKWLFNADLTDDGSIVWIENVTKLKVNRGDGFSTTRYVEDGSVSYVSTGCYTSATPTYVINSGSMQVTDLWSGSDSNSYSYDWMFNANVSSNSEITWTAGGTSAESITLNNTASDKFTFDTVPSNRMYDSETEQYTTVLLKYTVASGQESCKPKVTVTCGGNDQSEFVSVSQNGNSGLIRILGQYEDDEETYYITTGNMIITVDYFTPYTVTYTKAYEEDPNVTHSDDSGKIDIFTGEDAEHYMPTYEISPIGAMTNMEIYKDEEGWKWRFQATVLADCSIVFTPVEEPEE